MMASVSFSPNFYCFINPDGFFLLGMVVSYFTSMCTTCYRLGCIAISES
jgi:hypothetical protein